MPGRLSPRHEAFAQHLAAGKTQVEAHELAGFKPHRGNASGLAQDKRIQERVAELQAEQAETARAATEKAAERLSIDREWIMSRLVENAREAKDAGDFGPSNQALQLLGKEIGMFIDRSKVDLNARMTVEQWLDSLPS